MIKSHRRWFQAVLSALLLVLVGVTWLVFAPYQFGGSVGYVIVQGNSMEPLFHYGDLVLVRRTDTYRVGDIAAYKNAQLNNLVFHRITRVVQDHFVFKGDHNSWTDSYQPVRAEIIGKLWVHVPRLGRTFSWLRQPIVLAALAGAGGILIMAIPGKEKTRRAGKKTTAGQRFNNLKSRLARAFLPGTGKHPSGKAPRSWQTAWLEGLGAQAGLLEALFFVFGLIAFLSLALGIFAFLHPPQIQTIEENEYQQRGVFSYTASASAAIYDTNVAVTGQPVFPALSCLMLVRFDYALSGDGLAQVGGNYRLEALVRNEHNGWQRTIPLQAETPFQGLTFTSLVPLNICALENLVAGVEQQTDLHPGVYSLYILPQVSVTGQAGGQSFADTFTPRLTFQFDALEVYLANGDPTSDPLHPAQPGQVQALRLDENRLPLFGRSYGVLSMRRIAVWGLGLSLAGLLAVLLVLTLLGRRSRAAYIRIKYGGLLVESRPGRETAGKPVTEVASIDDLAKLAERLNLPILHACRRVKHSYSVEADHRSYRYLLVEGPSTTRREKDH
jgi:signal peptidase I